MNVPYDPQLPTHLLAACFNKTATAYKFYWFLSILERVENGETQIAKRALFAEMLAHSWYTINYFHVSFGKQDQLQIAVETIKSLENLTIDAERGHIYKTLSQSNDKTTKTTLGKFNGEVPHRFLSPWFNAGNQQQAYIDSQHFTNDCPYAVYSEHIELNPAWQAYLQKNGKILKDFCYWNLAIFVQARNPNVPDIPSKLVKSPMRKGLNIQRKQFWDIVLNELDGVDCIYTNRRLVVGDYAVEHFIPYAFVSHDLIWNLIPADPLFNRTKSDKLPVMETLFDPFYNLQQTALEIISQKAPGNKLLQDYLTIFPSLEKQHFNYQRFKDQVQPLITIASNNGFEFLR